MEEKNVFNVDSQEDVQEEVNELTNEFQAEQEQKLRESEEAYQNQLDELIARGYSRRKARRYLDAAIRRRVRKIVKAGKKRQEKLRKEGKLVDTSDINQELQQEFEDLSSVKTEEYQKPTEEF